MSSASEQARGRRSENTRVAETLRSLHGSLQFRARQVEQIAGDFASRARPSELDRLRATAWGQYYAGSPEVALPILNALVSQEPSFENVRKLGWAQLRQGLTDEAARTAKRLLGMRDDDTGAHELAAAVSLASGDSERAAKSAKRALELGGSLRAKAILSFSQGEISPDLESELGVAGIDVQRRLQEVALFRAEMEASPLALVSQ